MAHAQPSSSSEEEELQLQLALAVSLEEHGEVPPMAAEQSKETAGDQVGCLCVHVTAKTCQNVFIIILF